MLTYPVRECTDRDVAASVAQWNGLRHVYVSAVPQSGGSLTSQMREALDTVATAMRENGAVAGVVQQTVFHAESVPFAACRQIVREYYGQDMPAVTYVPQPPCGGQLAAVEALGLGAVSRGPLEIERVDEHLVIARHDGVAWIYAAQAVPRTSADGVYEKTLCTYQHLRRLLPLAGVRLAQVLRTWLYLGGIVDAEGPTQRYKELNRARAEFYRGVPFLSEWLTDAAPELVYPASTGIGTNGLGITLSAVAIATNHEVRAVPLENPRQTAAYSYSSSYSPKSPKFSRAMAVCLDADTLLFISGTASITQSETRHPGNVAAQAEESLENITALISEENLARHGLPGRGTTLNGLAVARVYIKHREDFDRVRTVCEPRLAGVPVTYTVADVCRPDLLVEIEGVAFSHAATDTVPLRRCSSCATLPLAPGAEGSACPESCPEHGCCPFVVLS